MPFVIVPAIPAPHQFTDNLSLISNGNRQKCNLILLHLYQFACVLEAFAFRSFFIVRASIAQRFIIADFQPFKNFPYVTHSHNPFRFIHCQTSHSARP